MQASCYRVTVKGRPFRSDFIISAASRDEAARKAVEIIERGRFAPIEVPVVEQVFWLHRSGRHMTEELREAHRLLLAAASQKAHVA